MTYPLWVLPQLRFISRKVAASIYVCQSCDFAILAVVDTGVRSVWHNHTHSFPVSRSILFSLVLSHCSSLGIFSTKIYLIPKVNNDWQTLLFTSLRTLLLYRFHTGVLHDQFTQLLKILIFEFRMILFRYPNTIAQANAILAFWMRELASSSVPLFLWTTLSR